MNTRTQRPKSQEPIRIKYTEQNPQNIRTCVEHKGEHVEHMLEIINTK